jgi:hypothetical protein
MSKTEKIVITQHGSGYLINKSNPLTPLIDIRAAHKDAEFSEWGSISIECNESDPDTVNIKLMAHQAVRPWDPKRNLVASIHLTPDEIKLIAEKASQVCIESKGGVYAEQNLIDSLMSRVQDLEEERKGFQLKIRELEKQLKLQEG